MASRRLDISSLLNDGGDDKQHQSSSSSAQPASFSAPSFQQQQIVAEPVVLAPHLRSNSSQRAHPPQPEYNPHNSIRDTHVKEPDIVLHSSSTHGRYSTPTSTTSADFSARQKPYPEYVEQDADRTRAAHPTYRSEQPSQPRPSSSRSSNSPHVAYRYPQASTAVSPTVSPSSNAVIERFPPVHHPPAYTKHPHSISQSQSRALEHPPANPYPQAQTSSSPSNFNLLVHIANEERRKLGGSEVADSMPRPGSPSRQHSRRSQYGGTSDLVTPESIKKPSDWYPGRGDRVDEAHREPQAPYPHRTQRMPIHDQPSQQPQPSIPHPSNHHIPSVPGPHVSPSEPSARLLDSRLRMQKLEEQRQKTEEQRRRHQLRLEEQKNLNDQREQQRQLQRLQMQREQQQRDHERMKAEVAARDRARVMEEKEREREENKFIERPRATSHAEESPHDRHQTSAPPAGTFPSASASPAPPRRPLSMESLLHPHSHPSPLQPQHRPFGSPAEASTSGQSHSSNTRPYQSQYGPLPPLEAPHPPRLPHPSRKSDPGLPSITQAQSPPQPLKHLTSPATSHRPTLSHLVASPSHQPHQTVSPSLHVLLSPSQASIRLPPPLSDPRPPKKPRVSPEDSYHHAPPSSTRLTPREEQTILALRDEQTRRREVERRQQDEREELRRKRIREMQLERERETELEGQRMRQESGSTSGKSHLEHHIEERKPDFPYPISAEPTSIFAPPHRPQIIELLPRDDPSPPPRPPPRQSTRTPIQASPPARTRVSPPRIVKLETVEGPPEVRQPKRLPPGSQEGRAKAARRVDSTSSHLTPHEALVNPSPEAWNSSDTKPVGEGPANTLMADVREERVDDERGPGRAKQVAKDKKGSRTHSLLRFPGSDAKPVSPPPQRSEPEKASPPSQPLQKQPISPKSHPSQDDVHKWLLEQSTDAPSPSRSDPKPEAKASPVAPAVGPKAATTTDATTNSSPAMTISDDAVAALEQELEDILMEEPEREADTAGGALDVDKEVTSLVAETLDLDPEPPRPKSQPRELERAPQPTSSMEVDVEDELLSLVDDKPQHAAHRGRSSPHMATLDAKPSSRKASESGSRPASPPSRPPSALQTSGIEPTPERGSMPPPAPRLATSKSKEKDSEKESSSAPPKKKTASKPKATTATASSKARAKPAPKPKPKNADSSAGAGSKASKSASKKVPPAVNANANVRSRSTSAMPSGSVGPEGETAADKDKEKENEPEDDAPVDDDKLYCVCKTKYDEDRVMIACDRCDEWYHTQCVSMPDLEVDLVDQFICPLCIKRHPQLSLCTTYKKRCSFGLSHPTPSSPDACHKPARGALSKYCSDECGFKCLQARIDDWAKQGGKRETLWENVKNAEKREGVVILHGGDSPERENPAVRVKPEKSKSEKEVERLNGLLDLVVNQREEVKMGMEVVGWRERLLELASDRAQQLGECGWDQRLCFGDEEYAEYGEGVLESYESLASGDVQSDVESEGEWWCRGPTKCERHSGWQGVRHKDVQKEKQNKEEALLKLTTREREIRKFMEDLVGQQVSNPDTLSKSPLAFSNNKLSNGHTNHSNKPKINGDAKKGKKRKTLA